MQSRANSAIADPKDDGSRNARFLYGHGRLNAWLCRHVQRWQPLAQGSASGSTLQRQHHQQHQHCADVSPEYVGQEEARDAGEQ